MEKRAIAEAEEQARKASLIAQGFVLGEDGHPLSLSDDDKNKIDELLESLETPKAYQNRLDYVKRLVDEDPKVVAQVLKTWIRKDV
jgi:flagellar M-ring protein FliF